jgi:hypothetical protein
MEGRPTQVGVQENARGVDDRSEQTTAQQLGLSAGLVGVAGGDCGSRRVDQHGLWKIDVVDRPGQRIYGRWSHRIKDRGAALTRPKAADERRIGSADRCGTDSDRLTSWPCWYFSSS